MEQITALRNIQRRFRLSIPKLAEYIQFPGNFRTLVRALHGRRIWEFDAVLIGVWLEEYEKTTNKPA
jgi:hypothetical protein